MVCRCPCRCPYPTIGSVSIRGLYLCPRANFQLHKYVCGGLKTHPISMNEFYVSLSKLQKPCCRPLSIKIIWLLLWTSLSRCPEVLLWLNIHPSTILVAEDANAHANSTFSNQNFYMFTGINIYPSISKSYACGIPCCCGRMPM